MDCNSMLYSKRNKLHAYFCGECLNIYINNPGLLYCRAQTKGCQWVLFHHDIAPENKLSFGEIRTKRFIIIH